MILNVIKKERSFVHVNLDDEFLKIPFAVWEKLHLYNQIILNQSDYESLKNELEFFYAKNKALRLLEKRSYFKNELFKKLIQLKFSKVVVESVISTLMNLGFIDDEKNIESFVISKIKTRRYGLFRIKNELNRKGVSKELIERSLSKIKNENSQKIQENIHILAMKKLNSLKHKNLDRNKIYQKLYSHLCLKGYESELVADELKKILRKDEFDY